MPFLSLSGLLRAGHPALRARDPSHLDYPAEGLDALSRYEREHPSFSHRLTVIRSASAAHVGREEHILELGAGTGHTARALREDGYVNLALGEMNRAGCSGGSIP